jgi:MATE family multidrug resistance protein
MRGVTRFADGRALAALAVPLALTQLAQVALTTTDTVMMGLLGPGALAAGGLGLVLFNQLRTMGAGLVTPVANQVAARGDGPGAADEVRELVRAGLVVATGAGLAGAALLVGLGQALPWLGQDPAVVRAARPFLLALAPGLLPCLWFGVLRQFTVGMRRPQALLRITVASIAVNAALNWALIHGLWGLPRLGLAGIGVATTLVYGLTFLALYAAVRRDPALRPMLSLRLWRARRDPVLRVLRLGVPVAATYGSEAGFFTVVALLMGTFGPAALAAHTAVNQLVYLVLQVSIGLSHAASISVSAQLARQRVAEAATVARTAMVQGAAVMAVAAVAYLAVPDLVLRPFSGAGDPALAVAVPLLAVAAVLQFADCAQNVGVGLLRGLDDTAGGFRVTLVGYWAVGLPAAWVLGVAAGLGPIGAWLGLLTGLATTAVLLQARFARGLAERRALAGVG